MNPLNFPDRSARPPREQDAPFRRKAASWELYNPNDNTQAPPDKFPPKAQARAVGRLFFSDGEDIEIILDSGASASLIHPRQIEYHDLWPEVFSCEPRDHRGLFGGRAILDLQIDFKVYVKTTMGLQSIEVRAYVLPWSDPRAHRIGIGTTDLLGNGIDFHNTKGKAKMKKGTVRACHFDIDFDF